MLYVPYAAPAPNALTEELVNAQLAELDPHFFIQWVPTAYWNARRRTFEGRYALMQRWTSNDPRMAEVQSGKVPLSDAHDLWCWFCEDMQKADSVPRDPAAMWRLIADYIGKADNTRFPWRQRMAQTAAKNMAQREAAKKVMADEVTDEAETQYYHSHRAVRSFGGLSTEA